MSSPLACPVCHAPLARSSDGRALRCSAKHSFDVAREGYVNLLAAGHGASRIEGDSLEMLRSRRRFLAGGHYDFLDDALVALARAIPRSSPRHVMLDIGCGEGHHTARISSALSASLSPGHDEALDVVGIDVSRDAIKLAARAHHGDARRALTFAVADVKQRLPLLDGSVDVAFDIFAPRNDSEMARVLTAPHARLLVVIPGDGHLAELRAALPALIGIDDDKRAKTLASLPSFTLAGERQLTRRATLAGADDVADLISMTPSARHIDSATLDHSRGMAPLDVTFDFTILALARRT